MIHSSASFTFLKKSKSLREEVSSSSACDGSINRPPYVRACLRKIYYHSLIIYDYLTYYKRHALRVILRRRSEAQTIALIIYDIPCIYARI